MKTRLWIFPLIVVSLFGCKSTALVTCNNIDKFESRSGVINAPFLDIGDVIILDTLNKTGSFIGHIDIDSNQINATEPLDTFEIISKTDFSISLSGKITKKESASIAATNSINNSSTFFLKNSVRQSIKDPISQMGNAELNQTLIKTLARNPNLVVLFVSGLVLGEEIQLKLSRNLSTSVDANIVKIGNIKLNIKYNCNDALNGIAKKNKGGGMFFKSTFFNLNYAKTDLMFMSKGISLSDYDLVNSLTRWKGIDLNIKVSEVPFILTIIDNMAGLKN